MAQERLFGTDGVRGVANVDLTALLALQLGMAAGHWVRQSSLPNPPPPFPAAPLQGSRLNGSAAPPCDALLKEGGDSALDSPLPLGSGSDRQGRGVGGLGRPFVIVGRDTRLSGD